MLPRAQVWNANDSFSALHLVFPCSFCLTEGLIFIEILMSCLVALWAKVWSCS